jgi:hypothetical protein
MSPWSCDKNRLFFAPAQSVGYFRAEAEFVHGGGELAGALNRGALNAVLGGEFICGCVSSVFAVASGVHFPPSL